jgi:sugar phosphate isomerase/epimerase
MKLGAFTTFTADYTFPEACRLLRSIGYTGVQPRIVPPEFAGFDPGAPFNPWRNNKGSLLESDFFKDPVGVLRPAREAGLEITSIASYISTSEMDRAMAMLHACHKARIRQVRLSALRLPPGDVDMGPFLKSSLGTYRELVTEARKLDVRPCLELHGGTPYPSPSGLMAFLREFDPNDVGVLHDPANMVKEGWESLQLTMNQLGSYLAEVHVKNAKWICEGDDANGCKRWSVQPCHLEEGVVNWPETIAQLKARGFKGWLIEEGFVANCDTFTRLKKSHVLLARLLSNIGGSKQQNGVP